MTGFAALPSREAILAHGIPAGLIEHYRERAHAARARAMGAFLAAVVRRLVPHRAPSASTGLAST